VPFGVGLLFLLSVSSSGGSSNGDCPEGVSECGGGVYQFEVDLFCGMMDIKDNRWGRGSPPPRENLGLPNVSFFWTCFDTSGLTLRGGLVGGVSLGFLQYVEEEAGVVSSIH
jgi:hypothetical protein